MDPHLRFVQDRVALFSKVLFIFAVTYLAMGVALALAGVGSFFIPGRESHLAAIALAFAEWQIARRPRVLPAVWLKLLDSAGTLGLSISLIVMGHRYARGMPIGNFAGLMSVLHIVFARAVIVPSTARRTMIVTAASFSALLISQQLLFAAVPGVPGMGSRWASLFSSLTLAGTGTALATLASHVIYGLHKQVRKARQLGQYALGEKIGEGGMGEIYRAQHAMLRRPTAIKLLRGNVTERDLRRFEREVQLTAELSHPNTISIYDYGRTPDGTFYYAMELLNGESLQTLVARHGAQPAARVIHILKQACGALREAHGAGLIHRDIKPDNVFLCRQGAMFDVVKLLDFGLVKQLAIGVNPSLSQVDQIIGTPLYMSPEAIASPDRVSAKSDLYQLGAVAYFLLTATPVFVADSAVELFSHHLHSVPTPPSRRTERPIPEDLERIVLACLAKEPLARPENADTLLRQLGACADASRWAEADASSWWQAHDASSTSRHSATESPAPYTMEVALEERLANPQ